MEVDAAFSSDEDDMLMESQLLEVLMAAESKSVMLFACRNIGSHVLMPSILTVCDAFSLTKCLLPDIIMLRGLLVSIDHHILKLLSELYGHFAQNINTVHFKSHDT